MHKSVNTHEIQANRKWKFHLSVENCKKELNSTRINSEKGSIHSNNDTKCVKIVMCIRSLYVVRVLFVETWYSRSENLSFQKLWTIFQFWTKWTFKNPHNHRFGSFFFLFLFSHTPKLITIDELLLSPLKCEMWNETIVSNNLFDADARNWNFLSRWWVKAKWTKN